MRSAPEEDDDDADTAQRGDEVDAFGQNVSKIVQQGNPLIEIRFITFNLTSRAYQTKSSPLEGQGATVPAGVWKIFLSFKRSRVRYS